MRRAPLLLCAAVLATSPLLGCREKIPPREGDSGAGEQRLEQGAIRDLPVNHEGGALDASPLSRALELALPSGEEGNADSPTISFDGESFVMVWEVRTPGQPSRQLWYARIAETGELLTAATRLDPQLGRNQTRMRLFCSAGTGDCVLWYYHIQSDENRLRSLAFSYDSKGSTDQKSPISIFNKVTDNFDVTRWRGDTWILAVETSFGLRLHKTTGAEVDHETHPPISIASTAWHPALCSSQQEEPAANPLYMLWRNGDVPSHATLAQPDQSPSAANLVGITGASEMGYSNCIGAGPNRVVVSFRPKIKWMSPWFFLVDTLNLSAAPRELELGMFEGNLVESLDFDMAVLEGKLLVLWQSDVDAPLAQIRGSWIDLSGPAAEPLESISDHRYMFSHPVLAAGTQGFGAVFMGTVDGLIRPYFRYLPLTELTP